MMTNLEPKRHTPAEIRAELLELVCKAVRQSAEDEDKTPLERCERVAFHVLALLDGLSLTLPSFEFVPTGNVDTRQFPRVDIREGQMLSKMLLEMMKEEKQS